MTVRKPHSCFEEAEKSDSRGTPGTLLRKLSSVYVTRSPRRRRRDAAGALATREKSRSTQADPEKKTAADLMRGMYARARTRVLTGGPLGKEEVPGLTVPELKSFATAMGLSGSSSKLDGLRAVCDSWFKKNGGPFVLSEERAGKLRLKWPDAEATAARLLEERAAAAPPPPDTATLERFKACGARVALPSRPLIHNDRRHKLLNHESAAAQKAAQSPEEFRQRGPASISFESIDRRSF